MTARVLCIASKLYGCYSSKGEIEIFGDRQGLMEFSIELTNINESDLIFELFCPDGSASPYDGYLKSIKVVPNHNEKLLIQMRNEVLNISGPKHSIAIFSENIEPLADQLTDIKTNKIPFHLHIEYHPAHYYLDEKSDAII